MKDRDATALSRRASLLGLLVLPLLGPGCTTILAAKAAKKALDTESTATFTFEQGGLLEGLDDEWLDAFGVQGHLEILETGAKILKLHGQYKDLIEIVAHLIEQGLELVASDEFSRGLLVAAVSFLRAAS